MSKTKIELDALAAAITSKNIVTSSKVDYKNPFFYVTHEVSDYEGNTYDTYILSKKTLGGAFVVAIMSDKILLVPQYRRHIKTVSYEIPAGSIEDHEDIETAGKRELLEEAGYSTNKITYVAGYYSIGGVSNVKHHVLIAENLEKKNSSKESSEIILEPDFFTIREINEMVLDGRITDGPTIAAIYYYTLYKEKNG